MFKELPNLLTISRILVIPLVLISMCFDQSVLARRLAAGLFLYACATDFLDGFLARLWKSESEFGRFLDPIADKLLVGSVVVLLVHFDRANVFPAIAIISREILVSGLREFLAGLKVSIPVSELAKFKTFVQMAAIFILILGNLGANLSFVDTLGDFALWFAAALTLCTGYIYLKATYKYFIIGRQQ